MQQISGGIRNSIHSRVYFILKQKLKMKRYMIKNTIIKTGRISLLCLLFDWLIVLLPMCEEGPDFSNKVYITQAKYTTYDGIVLDNGVGTYKITVSSIYKMEEDVRVAVEQMDTSFLDAYNKKNHTEYEIVPSEAVSFSEKELNIALNTATSSEMTMTIKKWKTYKEGVDYALPVKISNVSTGMPIISGSDFIVLELSELVVSNAALIDKGGFSPKDATTVFGLEMEGKQYGNITVEGKIKYTKSFIVPGNWRADIFSGFGLQVTSSSDGSINVRFPDESWLGSFGKLSMDRWHHFAITNNNGVVSAYLDGKLSLTSTYAGEMTAGDFSIGGVARNTGLIVDEFRIWKTIRTARQIKKYPNIVEAGNPDLLVYYRFDETSGNIAKDETSKKHDLEASGAVEWIEGATYP